MYFNNIFLYLCNCPLISHLMKANIFFLLLLLPALIFGQSTGADLSYANQVSEVTILPIFVPSPLWVSGNVGQMIPIMKW